MRKLPLHQGARELEDDCAVIEIGSETLVLTHDSMVEGRHYRPDASMADVAWKLVATNLSDLAAKGAEPLGVLLSYTLSDHDRGTGDQDSGFIEGLDEVLKAFDTKLLGGDTVAASEGRTLGITAIGRATHTPVPSRASAKPGDSVFVTGHIGRARLGFLGHKQHLEAFNRPIPRLAEGQALAPLATAMMDVSDGLLLDAYRMAEASGVTLEIDANAVPIAEPDDRMAALKWGDDYELLFTLPKETVCPVDATQIGTVVPREGAPVYLSRAPVFSPEGLGYLHS